jgi:MFS family permease
MKRTLDLLRHERRARAFFAALTQSALGTGAAYVALLLVAFERFHSPWAISIVLIADLVPAMALGPVFGAMADRWSRRGCAIAADVIRAAAFAGLLVVDSFGATVALALLAGAGTGLFTPATLAALPSLVVRGRLPSATSLYGAITDLGLAAGPGLAALALLFGGPELILLANAITFAISALLLARIDFGHAPVPDKSPEGGLTRSLLRDARAAFPAIRHVSGLSSVLGASGAALFFGGLVNVAELPFITGDLKGSEAVYSAAVALAGAGIVLGSLRGGIGGSLATLRRKYVFGLLVMGLGFFLSGLAPGVGVIFATFALAGLGNGLMLVHERLIIQATVDDSLSARVFGVKDALTAWAFGLSFLVAGALVSAFDPRPVIIAAGVGIVLIAGFAAIAVRLMTPRLARAYGSNREFALDGSVGKHGAHSVGGREHWLALLDDLR